MVEPNKPMHWLKKILLVILIAIAVLVVLFIIAVVASSFRSANVSISKPLSPNKGFALGDTMMEASTSAGMMRQEASFDATNQPVNSANITPKVIKTANLSITVDDVDKTAGQLNNEAILNGGFVQNSSVTENERGQKYANIILRVPASNFDTLISKISWTRRH